MAATDWHFPPLRELWDLHAETIQRGRVEGLGFVGAVLPATIIFADAGEFTRRSNLHRGAPALAAFIATHFARLIENWA